MHENQINICCIQESHLKDSMSFTVRGYQTFRSDRSGRTKGGVVTLVRNNISAIETNRYMEEAEFIGVKIKTKTSEFHVVIFYCPSDKELSLDDIQASDSNFLLVADFNSQSHSWGYNNTDKREEKESWQDENNRNPLNDPLDQPTFYSRRWHSTTSPDLAFYTDIESLVENGPQLGGNIWMKKHYETLIGSP